MNMNAKAQIHALTGDERERFEHITKDLPEHQRSAVSAAMAAVREPNSFNHLKSLLLKSNERFKRGLPIFREAALFREETGAMWRGMDTPSWYTELRDDPLYRAITTAHSGTNNFPEIDMHSTMMAWVRMKLRDVSGTSNWFRPTEALTYKLLATDLRGAIVADIHLPMDAFYIEMPPGVFYLEDPRTGWHEVRTLTLTQGEITQRTLDLVDKRHDSTVMDTPLGKRLLVECYGEPNQNSRDPFDDAWLFMSYLLEDPNAEVSEVVVSKNSSPTLMRTRGRCGDRIMDGTEIREFLLKFVLNFSIYLGSEKVRVEHIHEGEIKRLQGDKKWKSLRKNVQDRINEMRRDRVFEVGSDVVVDASIREYVRNGGTGQSLTYRSIVRGHWRNQAHGPGRALRTKKWIEPHIRGAELPTKVVGHNYKVK